jgi:hypothetical protein
MKKQSRFSVYLLLIVAISITSLSTCKDDNDKLPEPCTINKTTVNIGSTVGGNFYVVIHHDPVTNFDYAINFNNTNLNFLIERNEFGGWIQGKIIDLGNKDCLDFNTSVTPTSSFVAYSSGHGYYCRFDDGHIVKFIANWYNDGIVNISYVFQ